MLSSGFIFPFPPSLALQMPLNQSTSKKLSSATWKHQCEIQGQRHISHIFHAQPWFHPIQITHLISSLLGPPTQATCRVYTSHTLYASSSCFECYMRCCLWFIGHGFSSLSILLMGLSLHDSHCSAQWGWPTSYTVGPKWRSQGDLAMHTNTSHYTWLHACDHMCQWTKHHMNGT